MHATHTTTVRPLDVLRFVRDWRVSYRQFPHRRAVLFHFGPDVRGVLRDLERRGLVRRSGPWSVGVSLTAYGWLRLDGWRKGKPARLPHLNVRIDRLRARRLPCSRCGDQALNFTPLHRGHEYGGLLCCGTCGHELPLP